MIVVIQDGILATVDKAQRAVYRGTCQLCSCEFLCDWTDHSFKPYTAQSAAGPILINTVDQCPQCGKGPVVVRYDRTNPETDQAHHEPTPEQHCRQENQKDG